MRLYHYVDACLSLARELDESMTQEDVEALRADMLTLGARAWAEFLVENQEQIASFVRASPSERLRRKSWQSPQMRRRLVLAGIRHLQCAHSLLDRIDTVLRDKEASYRGMAALAGNAYMEIHGERIGYWPFDGEYPFLPGT